MLRQGREREAHTIYNKLLRNEPSDIGLIDSKKWIKAATIKGLETKLNSSQRTWWGT